MKKNIVIATLTAVLGATAQATEDIRKEIETEFVERCQVEILRKNPEWQNLLDGGVPEEVALVLLKASNSDIIEEAVDTFYDVVKNLNRKDRKTVYEIFLPVCVNQAWDNTQIGN